MKSRRKLLLILGVVLSLAIATGGTVAYLSDTDNDVNVMTLGNVKIDQIELERIEQNDGNTAETNVQEFIQAKPLYPAVGPVEWADDYQKWETGGSNQLFTDELKNVVDKFVFVKNTGKSDAYVRTLFAFEAGELTAKEMDNDLIHWNRNVKGMWDWTPFSEDMAVTIDGCKYYLRVATYIRPNDTTGEAGVVSPGDTTRPSLLQVFLDKKAVNEDMIRMDGNGNGTYDILVLSQAVQTMGFANANDALNEAFGEINANSKEKAVEWFEAALEKTPGPDYIHVQTYQELRDALAKGGDVLVLNDIAMEGNLVLDGDYEAVLNMNGKTLTVKEGYLADPVFFVDNGASLRIMGNGAVEYDNLNANFFFVDDGTLMIEDGSYTRAVDPDYPMKNICPLFPGDKDGKIIINGGYFDGGFYDENNCFESCRRNILNLTTGQYFRVYGGTFVGQNPAWGDQGSAYLCPHCDHSKTCQGLFLEGQSREDTELPAGYSIDESVIDDGTNRPVFTVSYSK